MAKENSIDLTGRVVSAVSNAMQGYMNEVSGTMRSLENVLQGLVAKAKSPSCENTLAEESRDSIVEKRRRNREVHSTRHECHMIVKVKLMIVRVHQMGVMLKWKDIVRAFPDLV
ncbi:hypothetical protein ACJMK2_009090 [Sinanodonta woodiana]